MVIRKAFKYRLVPTKEQEAQINATLGCCRFVYNNMLDRRIKAYKRRGENMSYNKMQNLLPKMKIYLPWLADVDSQALKCSCRCLDDAYKRFFKKMSGFPRFKSKRSQKQSYTTTNAATIHVTEEYVQLPLLGEVKYRNSRPIEGKIRKATVSKTPTGKYFVSVLCEVEIEMPPDAHKAIGLDVGITSFAVDNRGNVYANPKHEKRFVKRLAREQRRLNRRQKGSRNREKQRRKLARVHERVVNARTDTLHKLSSALVDENQVICVETLDIKGLMRTHYMARLIADASWGEFIRQLQYKAEWAVRSFIKVPGDFPSTQRCSHCGVKNPEAENLKVRKWICPSCGARHDRDENAAINIYKEGMAMLRSA